VTEADALSRLVQDIYDATLDQDLWSTTLSRTASFVGASAAAVHAKFAAGRAAQIFNCWGTDDDWVRRYTDEYVRFDPSTSRQFFAAVEQPISIVDMMPYDEYLDTRFYREWAQPQAYVDAMSAVLHKSGADLSVLVLLRDAEDGVADGGALRRLQMVAPHVRRAMLIAGMIEGKSLSAQGLADTLDAIATGVFLLDGAGKIVHANAAARAILTTANAFTSLGGRLAAIESQADRSLGAAIALASEADAAPNTTGVSTPVRGRDGELYVVHTLPLTSDVRRAQALPTATVALFVRKASFGGISAPEALARAYGLTPSELRVLIAVVEVGGGPEVADALGVAESTVKFHLRQLFEKTGTRRQAELVKLVAGFSLN